MEDTEPECAIFCNQARDSVVEQALTHNMSYLQDIPKQCLYTTVMSVIDWNWQFQKTTNNNNSRDYELQKIAVKILCVAGKLLEIQDVQHSILLKKRKSSYVYQSTLAYHMVVRLGTSSPTKARGGKSVEGTGPSTRTTLFKKADSPPTSSKSFEDSQSPDCELNKGLYIGFWTLTGSLVGDPNQTTQEKTLCALEQLR
ncbi:hypothetical protein STEG23_028161, partial [Scotinomys teguina]